MNHADVQNIPAANVFQGIQAHLAQLGYKARIKVSRGRQYLSISKHNSLFFNGRTFSAGSLKFYSRGWDTSKDTQMLSFNQVNNIVEFMVQQDRNLKYIQEIVTGRAPLGQTTIRPAP